MDAVKLRDLYPKLKSWFRPEDHKLRKLPGGGKWYYVPWQTMRDRLDDIYPDWEIDYSDPVQRGEQVVVKCHLKIAGVTRVGFGNSHAEFDDWEEEKKQRGTPEERAIACAFKRAMEQFGVCRYLDIQTGKEKHTEQQRRELGEFIKYMSRRNSSDRRDNGDPGAYNLAYQNGWIKDQDGQPAKNSHAKSKQSPAPVSTTPKPVSQSVPQPTTKNQGLYPHNNGIIKQLRATTGHTPDFIIKWCGHYEVDMPSKLPLEEFDQLVGIMASEWLTKTKRVSNFDEARAFWGSKLRSLISQGTPQSEVYFVALDELSQIKMKLTVVDS